MTASYHFQERKERLSKFESIRHSIAGIIKSPKSVLGSSTVSGVTWVLPRSDLSVLLLSDYKFMFTNRKLESDPTFWVHRTLFTYEYSTPPGKIFIGRVEIAFVQ